MRTVVRVCRAIIHIFLLNKPPLGRGHLLATYLRLRAKHLLLVKLLGISLTSESICGHRICFYHYPTFIGQFEDIFVYGIYSCPVDRERRLIIDCGANMGVAILFFLLSNMDGKILAFEPDADSFRALTKSYAELSSVTLLNKAVCDSNDARTFYYDAAHPGGGMNSLKKERYPKGYAVQQVQCCRLSDYVVGEVDLVKMDIEGAEYDVLNEMRRSGKLRMVKEMVIEYHHHLVRDEDTLSRFLAILEEEGFGYQIPRCDSGTSLPPTYQDIYIYAYRK